QNVEKFTPVEPGETAEAKQIARNYTRPVNDPRVTPKTANRTIVSSVNMDVRMSRPLDTSEPPANIQRKPRALQRPANDPRARKTADVTDSGGTSDKVADS